MQVIFDRLKEPSTYAGLTGFLVSLNVLGFSEGAWNTIFGAIAAVAAVVAMFTKERDGARGHEPNTSRGGLGSSSK